MKLKELFEDQTIPQLRRSIEVGFPHTKKRQHVVGTVRINNMAYYPLTANKMIRITADTTTSDTGGRHKQFLDLRNIVYDYADTDDNVVIADTTGKEYFVQPIALNVTNVGVFCDCPDYQLRFANFNIQNNAHVGPRPKPYTKVPGSNRGPVNPMKVPGMCKHILKVVENLKQDGVVE